MASERATGAWVLPGAGAAPEPSPDLRRPEIDLKSGPHQVHVSPMGWWGAGGPGCWQVLPLFALLAVRAMESPSDCAGHCVHRERHFFSRPCGLLTNVSLCHHLHVGTRLIMLESWA